MVLGVGDAISDLRSRDLLLVLDNFEHVLGAVPFVADLPAVASAVVVLATSRESLGLVGEQRYPVAPLRVKTGLSSSSTARSASLPRLTMRTPPHRSSKSRMSGRRRSSCFDEYA
jgi:predicted ATPase